MIKSFQIIKNKEFRKRKYMHFKQKMFQMNTECPKSGTKREQNLIEFIFIYQLD